MQHPSSSSRSFTRRQQQQQRAEASSASAAQQNNQHQSHQSHSYVDLSTPLRRSSDTTTEVTTLRDSSSSCEDQGSGNNNHQTPEASTTTTLHSSRTSSKNEVNSRSNKEEENSPIEVITTLEVPVGHQQQPFGSLIESVATQLTSQLGLAEQQSLPKHEEGEFLPPRKVTLRSRRHPLQREYSGPKRKRHQAAAAASSEAETIPDRERDSDSATTPTTTIDLDNIESLNPVRLTSSSSSSLEAEDSEESAPSHHHPQKSFIGSNRSSKGPRTRQQCNVTKGQPSSSTIARSNFRASGSPDVPPSGEHHSSLPLWASHAHSSSTPSLPPPLPALVVDSELRRIHRLARNGNPLEDLHHHSSNNNNRNSSNNPPTVGGSGDTQDPQEFIDLSGDDDLEELVRCPNCRVLVPPSNIVIHRLHCERPQRRNHNNTRQQHRPSSPSSSSSNPHHSSDNQTSPSPSSTVRGVRTSRGASSPLFYAPASHVFGHSSSEFSPTSPFRRTVSGTSSSRNHPRTSAQRITDSRRSPPVAFSRTGLNRQASSRTSHQSPFSTPGTLSPIFGSTLFGTGFNSAVGGFTPVEITPRGDRGSGPNRSSSTTDPQTLVLEEARRILRGGHPNRGSGSSSTARSSDRSFGPVSMGADLSFFGGRPSSSSSSSSRGRTPTTNPAPSSNNANQSDNGVLSRTNSSPAANASRARTVSTPHLFSSADPSMPSSRDISPFQTTRRGRRAQTPQRSMTSSGPETPGSNTDGNEMYRCRQCQQMIRTDERDDHNFAHTLQDNEDAETEEAVNRAARQLFQGILSGRSPRSSSSSSASGVGPANGFGIQFSFGSAGNHLTFTSGSRSDELGPDRDPFREILRQLQGGPDFMSSMHHLEPPQPPPGTPQNIIDTLPTSNFTPPEGEGTTRSDEETCMVCLDNYTTVDQLRRLPCLHAFHTTCIDEWLARSVLCPVCKVAVHPSLANPSSSSHSSPGHPPSRPRGGFRGSRRHRGGY